MFYFLFLLALVNAGKTLQPVVSVAIANKTAVVKPKSILDKVIGDPKQFVAEIQNLDPTALRTIITLLEDLLTTSEEREDTLNNAVSDADSAVSDASNGVADAEDVLTGKQQGVTDAEAHLKTTQEEAAAAVEAAEAALATAQQAETEAQGSLNDAKADHTQKVDDKTEAEDNLAGELDGLNHEQEVLREVIAILENLHSTNTPDMYQLVGNGWCQGVDGNRINMPGYSWTQTDIKPDGSASLCAQQCATTDDCIGYMSEDQSKCDILLTSDKNAATGIASVDGQTRNFCWRKKTQHSSAYKFVGNGWCMNANNNRINMPGYSWSQTDIKQDGSASLCAQQCSAAQNCIGYMSEDMSKCDILLTSDKNAASGIASVDGETRNFCWQKRTQR
jgi:hypothetical protein